MDLDQLLLLLYLQKKYSEKQLQDLIKFKNENGVVVSLLSKEEYYAIQSEKFVDEAFEGSLPAFVAAFTTRKKLTDEDVESILKMIDRYKK